LRRKRHAESAQMESEDVAAVKVRKTGDNPIKARKTRRDDLIVLEPR
jgi:hypothetical protein